MSEPNPAPGSRCQNCDAELSGPFCAACGQRALEFRASLGHLLTEAFQEAFEIDGRIRRTIGPFLFRPGFLAREYVSGRRVRYSSPFRIYLLFSFLFFFVARFHPREPEPTPLTQEGIEAARRDARISFDGITIDMDNETVDRSKGEPLIKWPHEFLEHFTAKIKELRVQDPQGDRVRAEFWGDMPKVVFLLLPVFALLLKLLFRHGDRFYVDHLILALQLHAFAYLLLIPRLLIHSKVLTAVSFAAIAVYVAVSVRRFYGQNWAWTIVKLVALDVLYLIPLSVGAVVAAMLAVMYA